MKKPKPKMKPGTFCTVGKNPAAEEVLAALFKAAGWKRVKAPRKG